MSVAGNGSLVQIRITQPTKPQPWRAGGGFAIANIRPPDIQSCSVRIGVHTCAEHLRISRLTMNTTDKIHCIYGLVLFGIVVIVFFTFYSFIVFCRNHLMYCL